MTPPTALPHLAQSFAQLLMVPMYPVMEKKWERYLSVRIVFPLGPVISVIWDSRLAQSHSVELIFLVMIS